MIAAGALELLQRVVFAPIDVRDPKISPAASSLQGLPPVLFQAGSTEVLLEPIRKTVEQLRSSGSHAELEVWEKMPHVFQAVHWLPEARQALACVRDFVQRHSVSRQR
jgi:acetyl esterase/lipase